MVDFFNNNGALIIFLHVLSAVFWVGGMMVIRLAVHPTLQTIEDKELRLEKSLNILGKFFNAVIPFIVLILFTAIVMAVGMGFKETALYPIVLVKEGIWTVMAIVFGVIYTRRMKAQKAFDEKDFESAAKYLKSLPSLLIPINIALGVVAIYLGVTLRGF